MAGPTPVSALIHAATMVTAGIFMITRLNFLFELTPDVKSVIAIVGVITALIAAAIGLVQNDIKKVLAYSTVSQLGLMFLALGLGAYEVAVFHVITHAFFKACLFLGSGSVIHALHGEQDMRNMGGLRKVMPITFATMLVSTLAIAGIFPFAGFWSKDEILSEAWHKFPALGLIAWLTAGLTAFYMARIYLLTFEGQFRGYNLISSSGSLEKLTSSPSGHHPLPHESSLSMIALLIFLTVPTVCIGWLGAPFPDGQPNSSVLSHWFYTDFPSVANHGWIEFALTAFPSILIGIIGGIVAWRVYGPHRIQDIYTPLDPPGHGWVKPILSAVYSWSLRRAYIDEAYDRTWIRWTRGAAYYLSLLDQWVIDGMVNISGVFLLVGGESGRYTEGGRIPSYLLMVSIGLTFLIMGLLGIDAGLF